MKNQAIVSVLGADRTGIVAGVASALAEANANIEDIRQSILDGVFSMTMVVTLSESETAFEDTQQLLNKVSADLGVQVNLIRAEVFRMMHRI